MATWRPDPEHFRVALDSALAQTWAALEVLVADDSPGDVLRRVVEARGDPRLRYLHRSPSLGVACNHWDAFARARGEYIAVLNQDDWIAPDFVSRLVAPLQDQPAAVLAFCDHWIIDANGARLHGPTRHNSARWGRDTLAAGLHRPAHDLVLRQSLPIAMGTVFRSSALPDTLPPEAGPAYDLWLGHLLLRGGGGAWFVPDRLSAWRTHDASLTSDAGPDWLEGSARAWQAIAADAPCRPQAIVARRHAASAYRSASTAALRRGDGSRARRLAQASLACTTTWKGLLTAGLSLLPPPLTTRLFRGAA